MKLSGVYAGERQHHGFSLHQQRKKGQRLWYFWLDKKITKPYFYNLTTIPTKNQGVKCTTKRYFFVRIHETRLLETQKVRICMIFELSKNTKTVRESRTAVSGCQKIIFWHENRRILPVMYRKRKSAQLRADSLQLPNLLEKCDKFSGKKRHNFRGDPHTVLGAGFLLSSKNT